MKGRKYAESAKEHDAEYRHDDGTLIPWISGEMAFDSGKVDSFGGDVAPNKIFLLELARGAGYRLLESALIK